MSENNAEAGFTGASIPGFEQWAQQWAPHWAAQAQQAASSLSHGFGDAFKQFLRATLRC